ncbi:MAG TPA: hypothetical protein VF416_08770 [Marmoricola sp.]
MSHTVRPTGSLEVEPSRPVRLPRDRAWDRARHAIAVGWIVVLVLLPVAGEKTADWSDVRDLVDAGKVTDVHVDGELPDNATGFATVSVHWRHGPLDYVTYVRQVRADDSDDATSTGDVSAVLHSAPSARLAELQPGLQISRNPSASYADSTMLGFEVPTALTLAPLALLLLGLVVLIGGPAPWRATPWAWFWWLWNPVGVAAFLLLSGPFPGIPAPRRLDRRLTGGWAFLLMLVVTSLSFTVGGFTVAL